MGHQMRVGSSKIAILLLAVAISFQGSYMRQKLLCFRLFIDIETDDLE